MCKYQILYLKLYRKLLNKKDQVEKAYLNRKLTNQQNGLVEVNDEIKRKMNRLKSKMWFVTRLFI